MTLTQEQFDELYPEEYYSKRLLSESNILGAKMFVQAVMDIIPVRSVVDMGCGVAPELSIFRLLGVEVKGIDRSKWAKKHGLVPEIEVFDLTTEYKFGRKYDLSMAFDFIEHGTKEEEPMILKNLTSASDVVMISVPWRIGDTLHFNERPGEYWIGVFGLLGYWFDWQTTLFIKDRISHIGRYWVSPNLQVFRRLVK